MLDINAKVNFKIVLPLLMMVFCFAIPGYCEVQAMPEISTGIPTVTPEQAVSKAQRIVMNIYGSAVELSPLLTLLIFVIGGIVGVFYKEARKLVLWAIIGLMLILWGPQLVGLVMYYRGL